jgi:hypothetical protein
MMLSDELSSFAPLFFQSLLFWLYTFTLQTRRTHKMISQFCMGTTAFGFVLRALCIFICHHSPSQYSSVKRAEDYSRWNSRMTRKSPTPHRTSLPGSTNKCASGMIPGGDSCAKIPGEKFTQAKSSSCSRTHAAIAQHPSVRSAIKICYCIDSDSIVSNWSAISKCVCVRDRLQKLSENHLSW